MACREIPFGGGVMKNIGYVSQIIPVSPSGTNSTMFTDCCGCAIANSERSCPSCGCNVIGYDEDDNDKRGRIRWENATRFWRNK